MYFRGKKNKYGEYENTHKLARLLIVKIVMKFAPLTEYRNHFSNKKTSRKFQENKAGIKFDLPFSNKNRTPPPLRIAQLLWHLLWHSRYAPSDSSN